MGGMLSCAGDVTSTMVATFPDSTAAAAHAPAAQARASVADAHSSSAATRRRQCWRNVDAAAQGCEIISIRTAQPGRLGAPGGHVGVAVFLHATAAPRWPDRESSPSHIIDGRPFGASQVSDQYWFALSSSVKGPFPFWLISPPCIVS
jgi:hypothetical protein